MNQMRIKEHDLNSLRGIVRLLQEENKRLKQLLDDHNISYEDGRSIDDEYVPDTYDEDQGARILPINPNEEIAKEFYRYFWGRTDVYARRGKKGGYYPQCSARWNDPNCPKWKAEKAFCDEDCIYKSWRSLEPWMIVQHMNGEKENCSDVLGVYPLFANNTCRFLVFDFDNHEKDAYKNDYANKDDFWKSEVDALRTICRINGIDALVERSRSGKGAHLWIFFKGEVEASAARAFGFGLLDQGAASVNLSSFKYYDRMYPSQDVLSKLGNLVALPLQGRALKMGNSAFVDDEWNAYPDQMGKLRSVRKISATEVSEFLLKWNQERSNEYPATKYAKENGCVRPWKRDECFRAADAVGGEMHIVLDDGLYVDSLNLLPYLQNQIKCLATIDNPIFYKNKYVGRSNYYNLRTISLWEMSEGYIRIPIGLMEKLQRKCNEAKIRLDILDQRIFGRPIRVRFKGELREQQSFAADHLEKYENGILCAPTAFGKTVLAAYMIAKRKTSTLILLENADLLTQWIDEFNKFLEIDEKPPKYKTKTGREKTRDGVIGTLISGKDKTTGIIDFAMMGSAYHKGLFFENIDSYGMVLIDECHHIASSTGQAVAKRLRAKYIYGLTATPNRSDQLDDVVVMLLGSIRHKYTAKEQADEQGLKRYVVPRFSRVVNISGVKLDIHTADDLIANSTIRNEQIVSDVEQVIALGRTPVILTKLKHHAKILRKMLEKIADHVYLIYGDHTYKENQIIKKQMLNAPRNERLVLVATGQKIGEGFNFPRLDTLMLAAPIKFEGRLIQYIGRLNRIYEGKEAVYVYDYVDPHISFFHRQYRNRLRTYKKEGYLILSDVVSAKQQVDTIYDGRDYMEVFERDIIEANEEIIIASPGLRRSKVDKMIALVKLRQEAGIQVTVITMNPDNVGFDDTIALYMLIDEMRRAGIIVRLTEDEGEHFAVIDKEIVWHGGMNILGKADVYDNLMRVINKQAAEELLEIADRSV